MQRRVRRWSFQRSMVILAAVVFVLFMSIELQVYKFTDNLKELERGFNPRPDDDQIAAYHADRQRKIKLGPKFHNHANNQAEEGKQPSMRKISDEKDTKIEMKKPVDNEPTAKRPVENDSMKLRHSAVDTSKAKDPRLYFDPNFDFDDRIVTQMHYQPPGYSQDKAEMKTILAWNGIQGWEREGTAMFERDNCPVKSCIVTNDHSRAESAHAILYQHNMAQPRHKRPPYQVWIMYFLESPYHTPSLNGMEKDFNWTSTYRHDSTIVAPYEKFVPYNTSVPFKPQTKNYAAGKTKQVAWFVSNCGAQNKRLEYAKELQKYISVDIYGNCGTLRCPRHQADTCFDKLNKDYKFYLAFENSNCWDYITEKFYVNGLQHDVIPIVMGGRPDDYRRQAPPDSHLHIDDFDDAKDLADYLHLLDKNDDLFNHYFRWKGTGEFVNTFWWCRACAMLHAPSPTPHIVERPEEWWRGQGVCVGHDSWRKHGYKPVKPYGRK